MEIYLYQNDKQVGPYTEQQLRDMVASGAIGKTEFAWHEGLGEWQPLDKIISFAPAAPAFPPPPEKQNNNGKPKSVNFAAIFLLLFIVGVTVAVLLDQQPNNPFKGAISIIAKESKELTVEKAQSALDQINKGGGTAVVTGIPSNNDPGSKWVEVTLNNFKYNDARQYSNPSVKYSGPATAVFQGYNDGRWVLKSLWLGDGVGGMTPFIELNITVK
jgi:hypothetical protein